MSSKDKLTYWEKRQQRLQEKLRRKTTAEIEKRLREYYRRAMERTIADFVAVYNKLLDDSLTREPTPADLYKLDAYWHMQRQLRDELTRLGDREAALLSRGFEEYWQQVYDSTAVPSGSAYNTISTASARQQINSVWLADGKTYSQRIWDNVELLTENLNENLINCVVTGKPPRDLIHKLQERFNVSYYRAKTLVQTEITHIKTAAAAQRYKDSGIDKFQFLADPDEKTCSVCAALDRKVFYLAELREGKNAPPMHPNDRCTIRAYIE